jgi:hypothetical protein
MPVHTADYPGFAMPPMFRVRVRYGGKDYAYNFSAYNDDMMLTESFLEHFLRRALDEFRKCAMKEVNDLKRETIERHKTALLSAVDDYTKGVR